MNAAAILSRRELLEWSARRVQQDQFDRDFYGSEPVPKTAEQIANERREMAIKKIRWAAQFDKTKRHTFGEDGREFFVAGIQVFKSDVRVLYKPVHEQTFDHVATGKRGLITDRSGKSRKRLSFTVANSETQIVGMIVLTWRHAPIDGKLVKRQLGDLFDAIRRRWGRKIEWLWWLEFQRRGAPHIHILTAGDIHDELGTVQRQRRGRLRTIYTGHEIEWMWRKWLKIIKAEDCRESVKFNSGGVWEKFDKPDGAARYCAKDAWKPHQTKVPSEYANVGAWWHRSRGFKSPEMISELLAGEDVIRRGLNISEGSKLFPVLFNQTEKMKGK